MTDTAANEFAGPETDGDGAGTLDAGEPTDAVSLASVVLSVVGFLTLLRLADRRDRSPAKALGLFLATTTESTLGTALGVVAIKRSRPEDRISRGFLMAAAGTVLGVITTVMNLNWMRTKRRL